MSAARLKEAAKVLGERAKEATPGPWEAVAGAWGLPSDGPDHMRVLQAPHRDASTALARLEYDVHGGADAYYIATMHPGVGLALADWLDTAGADLWAHGPLCSCGSGCMSCDDSLWQPHVRRALALADLILGGAS